MQPVSERFRGDLRTFAFCIGNGALDSMAPDADAFDYDDRLNRPSDLLGTLFTIYVNTALTRAPAARGHPYLPYQRAAQYLAATCLPAYAITPPLAAWEYRAAPPLTLAGAISSFTASVGQGTLAPAFLAPSRYLPHIVMYGSFLEQILALFSNSIKSDVHGQIVEYEHACWRAAQYMRASTDPTYVITPAFEPWETELV